MTPHRDSDILTADNIRLFSRNCRQKRPDRLQSWVILPVFKICFFIFTIMGLPKHNSLLPNVLSPCLHSQEDGRCVQMKHKLTFPCGVSSKKHDLRWYPYHVQVSRRIKGRWANCLSAKSSHWIFRKTSILAFLIRLSAVTSLRPCQLSTRRTAEVIWRSPILSWPIRDGMMKRFLQPCSQPCPRSWC